METTLLLHTLLLGGGREMCPQTQLFSGFVRTLIESLEKESLNVSFMQTLGV